MGLGAASVKGQVRIGGNGTPNGAAVLDLNATDATNNGTKGLALPRVSLSSNTAQITSGVANLIGMLVYNTSGSLSTGVYYWSGTNWNRVDGATLGGDTIVGNEVTNATANRGLVRAGSGTASDPFTLGIASRGVDTSMLKTLGTQNSILVSTTSGWRYMTFDLIYDTGAIQAAPNVELSYTYSADGCMGTPQVMTYDNDRSSRPVVSFNNMTYEFHTWSTTNGIWQVQLFCWRIH